MAIMLQMTFRAYPNDGQVAAVVLETVFVWLNGKFCEVAIMKEDKRIIRREGMGMFKSLGTYPGNRSIVSRILLKNGAGRRDDFQS